MYADPKENWNIHQAGLKLSFDCIVCVHVSKEKLFEIGGLTALPALPWDSYDELCAAVPNGVRLSVKKVEIRIKCMQIKSNSLWKTQ